MSAPALRIPPRRPRCPTARGVVTAGFQNSHVHFMEAVWNDAADAPGEKLAAPSESMLTRYGFTTVFDTASDQPNTLALRDRIEEGDVDGPRIRTVGIPLYPPDGIPSYIQDLPPAELAKSHQPRTAAEAREAVRRISRAAPMPRSFSSTRRRAAMKCVSCHSMSPAQPSRRLMPGANWCSHIPRVSRNPYRAGRGCRCARPHHAR